MLSIMSGASSRKPAWEDKFRRPASAELMAGITDTTLAQVVVEARGLLSGLAGMAETVAWQGLPWRWAFIYRHPATEPVAWAYLIPDPTRPQIAVPLHAPSIESLGVKRFKRYVREGIARGRPVGETLWTSWDVMSKSQLEEVTELLVRKFKLTIAPGPDEE
ncbi:MAG: hypothetical protein H7Y88_07180 [Phycisphaerales bacterium]|nr:hypothetical protein [Phycisphaerales bacterium]